MIDAIDSYYKDIKTRILSINPSRLVIGAMEAEDWPVENVKMEALYLLVLPINPVQKQAWSPSNPIYKILVQWVWLIAGTDLTSTIKGKNRGDKHRTHFAITQEMIQAHYPQFTEKKYITTDGIGTVTFNSYSPQDYIRWTPPEFRPRPDRDSGLIYGACSTTITTIEQTILA